MYLLQAVFSNDEPWNLAKFCGRWGAAAWEWLALGAEPEAPNELPDSPLSMAIPLIARSGVWRSEKQYETTIYLLWPLQMLWEIAMREGTADLLRDPAFLKRHSEDVPIRRVFIQGEGGSGKTHFQVEVVLPIARHFFGEDGVKAISPTNATARSQHGSQCIPPPSSPADNP